MTSARLTQLALRLTGLVTVAVVAASFGALTVDQVSPAAAVARQTVTVSDGDVVDQIAAHQMSLNYGVTYDDALAQMSRQSELDVASATLSKAAGASWSGSFIDHTSGGLLVALTTNPAALSAALPTLPSAVRSFVSVRSATSSLSVLERMRTIDAHTIDSLVGTQKPSGQRPSIYVDIPRNRLVLELANAPSHNQGFEYNRTTLAQVAARLSTKSAPLSVSATPSDRRNSECDSYYLIEECDAPLRGGTYLRDTYNGSYCTAGVNMTDNSTGLPYVLTAGHCDVPLSDRFDERQPLNGNMHAVGSMAEAQYGPADAGAVSYWNPAGWQVTSGYPIDNKVLVRGIGGGYPTTENWGYPIHRIGLSSELVWGDYLCKTGASTGTTCGEFQRTGAPGVDGVTNLGIANYFSCQGDSGGPVYIHNVLYGITVEINGHSSSSVIADRIFGPYTVDCDIYYSLYQGAAGAQQALGMTVVTG